MIIKLLGWSSKGFRCPDATLSMDMNNAVSDICFIQMPNGTGKTTTLKLLNATLSGSATSWSKNDIQQLRKKEHLVHHGTFIVHLGINNDTVTIELNVDFNTNIASFRTSSNLIGGIRDGWSPPSQLTNFLNPKFVKLFIFDGELANKLLDNDFDEASNAIEALFQLYIFKDIISHLDDYWNYHTRDRSNKTNRSINSKNNELSKLEIHLSKIKNKHSAATNKIKANNTDIHDISEKIDIRIKNVKKYRDEYDKIINHIESANSSISIKSQDCMRLIRIPAYISKNITSDFYSIKEGLDKLKLPSNTSKQFFIELANNDFCICGNQIGENEKHNINNLATKYLSSEITGFLNSFKSEVNALSVSSFVQDELSDNINELNSLLEERDRLLSKKRYISQQLQESGDNELKELEKKKTLLEKENLDLQSLLDKYNSDSSGDPLRSSNIDYIQNYINTLKDEIAIISDTVTLKSKTDILKFILKDTHKITKEHLTTDILNKFRNRVDHLFPFSPIQIESIDGSIKLSGNQEAASVGQTLGIAYSFLTTLLQWGTHSFPLVVDSPAGPLDYTVRREVASIIPLLSEQFISFIISSERPHFVDIIKKESNKSIKSLTLLRKTDYTNKLVSTTNPCIIDDTLDGYVIDDDSFFYNFDMDEEDNNV